MIGGTHVAPAKSKAWQMDRQTVWQRTSRIYHDFEQGQGNPPECQRFEVHNEACRVMEVAYLWHEGGFPCPCTKWWLIIFLLSPLIAVRNPLFYFKNYYITFSDHKTGPTRCRVIVKVMTSLHDHHFRFVHNGVVGDKTIGDKLLNFNKTHGHTCLG